MAITVVLGRLPADVEGASVYSPAVDGWVVILDPDVALERQRTVLAALCSKLREDCPEWEQLPHAS